MKANVDESTRDVADFLCIGAQKAGTTWLDSALRQHPDIWMPPMKEVHYFDYVHRPDFRKWILWHLRYTAKRDLKKIVNIQFNQALDWNSIKFLVDLIKHEHIYTDNWYRFIFSQCNNKLKGEITPEYSVIGVNGINHIKSLNSNVKIIYIIRGPIDRAWSQLKMNCSRKVSTDLSSIDLKIWFDLIEHPSISDRGNYSTFIPQWDEGFNSSNIKYIPFGQIKRHPQQLIVEIENFLQIRNFDGYQNLDKIVHKGNSLKMPFEVKEKLENKFQSELMFLKNRFDSDFLENIK